VTGLRVAAVTTSSVLKTWERPPSGDNVTEAAQEAMHLLYLLQTKNLARGSKLGCRFDLRILKYTR